MQIISISEVSLGDLRWELPKKVVDEFRGLDAASQATLQEYVTAELKTQLVILVTVFRMRNKAVDAFHLMRKSTLDLLQNIMALVGE